MMLLRILPFCSTCRNTCLPGGHWNGAGIQNSNSNCGHLRGVLAAANQDQHPDCTFHGFLLTRERLPRETH